MVKTAEFIKLVNEYRARHKNIPTVAEAVRALLAVDVFGLGSGAMDELGAWPASDPILRELQVQWRANG